MRFLTRLALRRARERRPPAIGRVSGTRPDRSPYHGGVVLRPDGLSWLIARAVTLQYR